MACDIVVCAHNEATTVGAVLDAATRAAGVASVICVCDACTDATPDIASGYADAVLTIGAHNKGTAMRAGVELVATDNVVFLDADISGLRPEHVTALCTLPPLDGQLVGVRGAWRGGIEWLPRVLGSWPSVSGERRVPTWLAQSLPLGGSGWGPETMLNVAVARLGLPHRQIILRGVRNPPGTRHGVGKVASEAVDVATMTAAEWPGLLDYWRTQD